VPDAPVKIHLHDDGQRCGRHISRAEQQMPSMPVSGDGQHPAVAEHNDDGKNRYADQKTVRRNRDMPLGFPFVLPWRIVRQLKPEDRHRNSHCHNDKKRVPLL